MAISLFRPYCTLEQVQRFVGNIKPGSEDAINDAINRASRFIDKITGMIFYKKTVTDEYIPGTSGGNGWEIRRIIPGRSVGGLLVCPWRPIISITSITENNVLLTENVDYYVISESGIIERASGNWPEAARAIKISAVFGYDTTDDSTPSANIPQDVQEYAVEIAGRRSGLYVKNFEQLDGTVVALSDSAIPKWIVDRLSSMAMSI